MKEAAVQVGLQTTLLLCACLIGLTLSRSAEVRALLCRTAVLGCAAAILAAPLRSWLPSAEMPRLDVPMERVLPPAAVRAMSPEVVRADPASPMATHEQMPVSWEAVWLAGAALLTAQWALGWLRLQHLKRGRNLVGSPTAKVRVFTAPRAASPFVTGLLRPEVYLPAAPGIGWSEPILIHELEHVRRLDLWFRFAHRCVRTLLWPQPLVWLIGRPMDRAAEDLCDQAVLRSGVKSSDYARLLLSLQEFRSQPSGSIGAASRSSEVGKRVEKILREHPQPRLSRVLVVAAAMTLACLTASSLMASPAFQPTQLATAKPFSGTVRVVMPDGTKVGSGRAWIITEDDTSFDSLPTQAVEVKDGLVAIPPQKVGSMRQLVVSVPGAGIGFVRLAATGAEHMLELRLPQSASLRGRVLRPDGAPAANAKVQVVLLVDRKSIEKAVWLARFAPAALGLEHTADAGGMFEFRDLPRGFTVRLDTPDAQIAQPTVMEDFELKEAENDRGDWRLELGARIRGRVVELGKGVGGVAVGAQTNDELAPGGDAWGYATTGSDGSYTIGRMRQGAVNIIFDERSRSKFTAAAHEGIRISTPGEMITVPDLQLIPGEIIFGKVTDEYGKPLAGVSVGVYSRAHPPSSAWVQMARTDAKGGYRVRVPAGSARVYVMDSGWESSEQNGDVLAGKGLRVDFRARPR